MRIQTTRFLWPAFGLGLAVLPSLAQRSSEIDLRTRVELYREIVGREIRDPSLNSPVSPPAVEFTLSTESKNSKAKAMVGLRIGADLFFDVRFIAPLSDSDSDVEPIDLDGLSKSSVVDAGIHYLAWNPAIRIDAVREILEEYLRRHPEEAGKRRDGTGPISLSKLKEEPDLRRRFLEAVEWGAAYFAACRLKVGRQGFSYADENFKETSTQKTSRAVEAAAGILTPRSGYFGLGLEYQVFFDAAAAVELILPYGGGSSQQVKKLVLRPPYRRERLKIRAEYRKAVTDRIALNPRLSYFPGEKITLAELPIYLFRNPDEGLNGGVTMSWTSKGDGRFGLGIFIGATFSMIP